MARRRIRKSSWAPPLQRMLGTLARASVRAGSQAMRQALKSTLPKPARASSTPTGDWTAGLVIGPAGVRRYRLYQPPAVDAAERLPLIVMLHGCGQDAETFALSTRMNRLAASRRFLVLYPEQDRRANLQGCWNWFDTDSRRAYREAATLSAAVEQVCRLHPVDPQRVAIAGLSAGASMAALMATRYPAQFKALVMHSGIPPGAAHSTASALGAMRGRRTAALPGGTLAWPPLLVIHGGADRVVAPGNGRAAAMLWAEAAGAHADGSRVVQRGKRRAMTVFDFKLASRTIATLCEVDGLGHAWSGGAKAQAFGDAAGPDASRMIWAFAARHFGRAA